MDQNRPLLFVYTLFISCILVIAGTWGLFKHEVFGIFYANRFHSLFHLLLGIAGLYSVKNYRLLTFCTVAGLSLFVIGMMSMIAGTDEYILAIFNVNLAYALFNVLAGVGFLIFDLLFLPGRR